jgi:hypothetical protein
LRQCDIATTNGPFENLSLLTLIQTGVSARRVGQLYRLQMCATYLGFLLAYLAAPSLFGWFGLRPVIMAAGLLTLPMAAWDRGVRAVSPLSGKLLCMAGRPLRCVVPCPADPVAGGVCDLEEVQDCGK